MTKKTLSLFLSLLITLSMLSFGSFGAGAVKTEHSKYVPGAGVETNKYYFAMPGAWLNDNTKDNNDAAGCYWWDATDSPGDRFDNGWPGYEADKEEGEASVPNMFSIRAPKDASTILWNNYLDGGMDKTKSIFDDAKQVDNKNVENYAWGDSDTYSDSFWTFVYKTAADQLGMDIAEEDIEASVDDINAEAKKHPEKLDFTKVFGDKYGKNFYFDYEINDGIAMSFDNMVYIVDLEHVHMDYTMVPEGKLQYSGEFYFYYGDGEYGMWPTKELAEEHEGTEYFAKDADGNYTAANKYGVVMNEDGQVVIGNFTGSYWSNEDATKPATPDEPMIIDSSTTGDCTWKFDEATGTLTISGNGAMGNYYFDFKEYAPWKNLSVKQVVIENGVTSIGKSAFYGCTGLTSVTIPGSVTSIGNDAFYNCTGLKSVTIPDSVTSIGERAFYGCTGLTSVTIPDSVTRIDRSAFYGCESIISITVSPDNPVYNSQNNCNAIIETKTNTLIIGCKSTVIPDSVTSIGESAFYGCEGLTSVTIPDSVTSIGESAFYGCEGLTSVTIGNSVTNIGWAAFGNCTGLTSITIPDSVTSIDNYAFDDTAWYDNQPDGLVYAGKVAYKYKGTCPSNVKIKAGTLGIAGDAFFGTGLESVTIPDSVTSIGNSAFRYCEVLKNVTIGNGVTSIGGGAFWNCTGLSSVTIPDSVTSIGSSAFSGCEVLTDVTIPDSVTRIGGDAFDNTAWYNNQPYGLVYAGKVAYKYKGSCPAKVEIKAGTLGIAGDAFSDCTSLTSVIIPNSVTSIGDYAFSDCTGLTSVTIPDSVTSIDEDAFKRCTSLTSVTIPNSVTSIGSYAFSDCTGLTSVTIPDSVTSIGDYAFGWCTGMTSVTIPDSVTSIGEDAFYGCKGLTSVTIPGSVTSIGKNAFGYYYDSVDWETKKIDNFTIYGSKASAAETYAKGNGFIFVEKAAPAVLKGDLNGDGKVNGADAGILSRYTSGWKGYADKIKNMDAADINGDGKVNGADAGLLSRYTSGWESVKKYFTAA